MSTACDYGPQKKEPFNLLFANIKQKLKCNNTEARMISVHLLGFGLHTNLAYSGHTPKAGLIKAAEPGARSEQIDRNLYFPPGANRAWSNERTNENG